MIYPGGIGVQQAKVEAIAHIPGLGDVSRVRAFLGLNRHLTKTRLFNEIYFFLILSGDHSIELKITFFSTFFCFFALFCNILILFLLKKILI